MQETPTIEQSATAPQPPVYSQHPYQEYAAVEQPPAPQPPTYQQQPPVYPSPMYPPPLYPPPPKKKMSTGMKWLIVAVVILALGLVGGIFYTVGRSATSRQPTPTQQATPAPTQNPPTVTPKPTQPPVVAAPKLLDNISVFEAAYGHPQYMQYFSGKQYYDTAYQFTHNGKNIYVFTLHDKVTAVGMRVADSTLDDLKQYLPKDAGKPYDGGNGTQVYPMTSGEIGLGVSEGYNILLFKPYEQ